MTEEQIKKYLKENLSIDVITEHEDFFGHNRIKTKVILKLEGKIISENYDTTSVCSS